jgi:flagellin
MGFRVNTNVDALKAYQQLANANKMTSEAQLRMASGKRIQQVADDTSGFNIGTSLKGKVAVMKGAQGNIAAAKNLMSTAEGALLSINDLLTKIEGKMADSTNPTTDRTSLANDIKALASEISSILNNTKFNDSKLFATSAAQSGFAFQVGELGDTLNLTFSRSLGCTDATTGQSEAVGLTLGSFTGVAASTLGCTSGASSVAGLSTALGSLKAVVSDSLGQIGNFTQRLNIKDDTLNVAITNAESSISRLFDADMAMEQLNATKGSILQQASTAMFAQLNFAPQQVLQLFG